MLMMLLLALIVLIAWMLLSVCDTLCGPCCCSRSVRLCVYVCSFLRGCVFSVLYAQ